MRIAVSGAAGFVGANLVKALRLRGVEAIPIVRAVDERARALGDALPIDDVLRDARLLDGIDVLVHLAAIRHRHGTRVADYYASNVDLVAGLLAVCEGRVRRFVHVSSVGVYGFPERLPITEAYPYAPETLYSTTKVEAERALRRAAREIEIVIARPTIVYGRGDVNGMLDKMAAMIRAGRYRIVGDGRNTLHHTHVDDLVDGLWLAATAPAARGEDFIFAGPETTTLARLSELVARAVGKRLPAVRVPLPLARAVATGVDIAMHHGLVSSSREPPVNHEKLDVMTRSIAFDCGKARRLLGYAPRVGYEEGTARTLGSG
ncbi:MAG TPA: NAD-dependent epimerase/dehydratase family protein [Polyangiaceae bacterium]|nr:NAD-dependent epimerase/dehydratase family protein [Polyangiaceae bacterium]